MERRDIDLKDLDAALEEAKRLHASGYEKVGEWDLSQICEHITMPINMAIDGSPFKANFLMRTMAILLMKKKFFRDRKIKPGLKAPGNAVFATSDEATALANLEKAIERFKAHDGPMQMHPFFGNLSKELWHDFNTIHCSHHLAFLVPKAD